jgi:Flp pilus assembly protein TadD
MSERTEEFGELFSLGLFCWDKDEHDRALSFFQKAHAMHPDEPVIASYLGAAFARAGLLRRGLELCLEAARKDAHNDVIALNLGWAYLWAGDRWEARRIFIQGAKESRDAERFREALKEIGMRRKPVLRFLSRDNSLNQWLGKLTYRRKTFEDHDM